MALWISRALLCVITAVIFIGPASAVSPFTWTCRNNTCTKIETAEVKATDDPVPLEVCKLNCNEFGALWPKPTGKVELGSNYLTFYPQNVIIESITAPTPEVESLIKQAVGIFREYLLKNHPDYKNEGVSPFPGNQDVDPISRNKLVLSISVVWPDRKLKVGTTTEEYTLSSTMNEAKNNVSTLILANTYFGARHALESLSQLIAYDNQANALRTLDRVTISDGPMFSYRGLLIDTSRNFLPIDRLKRVVDGMSYNKLNMLHWHITDTHSFPFYSKSVPQMTQYGAYSERQVYSIEDMRGLVEYARVRGVKIVAEFDAPAHAGNGWQWGPKAGKGEMALCINKEPWANYCVEPPCGQLNPANPHMYEILAKIYKDMLEIFDNELFHMGGDEVKLDCWLETQEIIDYLKSQGKNNTKEAQIGLWGEFQEKAYKLLMDGRQNKDENITGVMWTSELASVEHVVQHLPADKYAIQIWTTGVDPVIPYLVQNKYKVIFSNYDAWYLDCGYGAWIGTGNNWCSPYKGWQVVYSNNPLELLASNLNQSEINAAYKAGQILGGEAALWAEQVDEFALESKLWPRSSALAERLWTNPSGNWYDAEPRMVLNRQRYVQRGLHPDRLQPEWCYQNEKLCYG